MDAAAVTVVEINLEIFLNAGLMFCSIPFPGSTLASG